jgi:hypothetical protein
MHSLAAFRAVMNFGFRMIVSGLPWKRWARAVASESTPVSAGSVSWTVWLSGSGHAPYANVSGPWAAM